MRYLIGLDKNTNTLVYSKKYNRVCDCGQTMRHYPKIKVNEIGLWFDCENCKTTRLIKREGTYYVK